MNNEELKEKQKLEALERLKILQKEYMLHKNVLDEFKKDKTIYYSENFGGFYSGILYWLHNRTDFVNIVKEIEEKRNIYVYHCILNHYRDVDVLSMLYVSADKEFWEDEKNQLKDDGYVGAYLYNFYTIEDNGFGNILITGVNGGLDRVS